MSAPQRIQLSRSKGWRKPEGAVVVSRPSRWGNPFRVVQAPGGGPYEVRYGLAPGDDAWVSERIERDDAIKLAVDMFDTALWSGALLITVADVRRDLAGKALACWCSTDGPCHGDVLLAIANTPDDSTAPTSTDTESET